MRKYLQLSIRDLLWPMLVLGLALGWWRDRTGLAEQANGAAQLRAALAKSEELQVIYQGWMENCESECEDEKAELRQKLVQERNLTRYLAAKLRRFESGATTKDDVPLKSRPVSGVRKADRTLDP